jgi:predicted SAM-dependent methyltransferase
MSKLHLGCGPNHLDGWLNFDIDPASKADRIADCTYPDYLSAPHPITHIFSSAFLEHLPYMNIRDHLEACHDILADGGKLLLMDIPNAVATICLTQCEDEFTWEAMNRVLLCEQEVEPQRHKALFTPRTLFSLLKAAGFDGVSIFVFTKPWEGSHTIWMGAAAGKGVFVKAQDVLDIYPRAAELGQVTTVI